MANSKKYQIFVSSTFEDLKEERNKVFEAIYSLHHIPSGMEYFNSADDSSWKLIQKLIAESDYYIIIIGHRYGTLDSKGISFTEKEYKYAKSKKIPILSFIRDRNYPVPPPFIDSGENKEKLDKFIELVKRKQCAFWLDKSDLATKVLSSLNEAFKSHERPGWVRGIDSLVKLTDNIKEQISEDISNVNIDKQIAYELIKNNIINLKEILKSSVYDNKDISMDDIGNVIMSVNDYTYEKINKDKLTALLKPAMVHSFIGDVLNDIPTFQSFTKEYILLSDNLKTVLGLLKYKDNILAQHIVRIITFSYTLIRWDTELSSILKSSAKASLISGINKESYKNLKPDDSFNLMHPIVIYYVIMHQVIIDIVKLEKDLKSPTQIE